MTLNISSSLYLGCGHPGLAAPDGTWEDGACLIVPGQDLGDAAMAHSRVIIITNNINS